MPYNHTGQTKAFVLGMPMRVLTASQMNTSQALWLTQKLRLAKTRVLKSKTRVRNTRFQNTALRLLLFSVRQRFRVAGEERACRKSARKHWNTAKCGNRLRFGMRAQNAAFY